MGWQGALCDASGSAGWVKLVRVKPSPLQLPCPASLCMVLAEPFLFPHRNVIHGSDSVESARQEISLWFRPEELTCWEDAAEHWIYE